MNESEEKKVAVTVAEMARMVGLSRARFYQLVQAGVFPAPERQAETGRPFYGEEAQARCLEVRRRNCGVNGQTVLFYARRLATSPSAKKRKLKSASAPKVDPHAGLVNSLKALGLTAVTPTQVEEAMAAKYPKGTAGVEENEVIVTVFNYLKASGCSR